MSEFKTFKKNENDNWEEYKDLINEDTKFMMRDENGNETEMTPREVINQLYQDNKSLENIINNLQSKIDKSNQYLEEYFIFDDKNGEYYQTHTFDKDNAKELHDILKEDK